MIIRDQIILATRLLQGFFFRLNVRVFPLDIPPVFGNDWQCRLGTDICAIRPQLS